MFNIRISIPSKIVLTLLACGLICLAAGGVIGYLSGIDALTGALTDKLTAQREIKKQRIEAYIRNELRFTDAAGTAPETVDAARAFIAAFHDMHAAVAADAPGMARDQAVLEDWYAKVFFPLIDKVAGDHPPLAGMMPADAAARRLQADYIAGNPYPRGQGARLLAAPGGSPYDAVHARFHPMMKRIADTIGFYDINLMDTATGDVVYTVAKEPDFASNMYHGPFQRSGFAQAAQRALDPANGGKAVVQDYSAYMPSGFAPQMFTAVPIVDHGQTIAVFVAQIDIRTLNNLLTDGQGWRQTGQGETGEVLLIGEDRLFRSQSRFMATQPDEFLAQVRANGVPEAVVDRTRTLGTTILALTSRAGQVDLALRNQTGIGRFIDTRGVDVVAAYGPIEIGGLRWVIQAKQDASEAFAPAARLNRVLLVAAAVAAIILTFVALICSALFTRPLRHVIAGMRAIAADGRAQRLAVDGNDEFAELARGFNAMADAINDRDRRVAEANARADALLRDMYPAGLAERIRCGAEVDAETVVNTTVAVTWMDGLDALAADRSAAEISEILEALLGAINGAAAVHAIEPVSRSTIRPAAAGGDLTASRIRRRQNVHGPGLILTSENPPGSRVAANGQGSDCRTAAGPAIHRR